jgi:hypothetical protein
MARRVGRGVAIVLCAGILHLMAMTVCPRALAAPIAAGASDGFVDTIGINIHSTHYLGFPSTAYDNWPAVINAVGDVGIRNVRDHVLDPVRLNQLTAATGAKVQGIIEQHAATPQGLVLDQSKIPDQLALAKQVNGIAGLEGPNEYNELGGANWMNELRAWQQAMYTAAKADPALKNLPVIGPSIDATAPYASLSDLAPYADAGNVHSYPAGAGPPLTALNFWLAAGHDMVGSKPVWSTETGYHHALLTNNPFDISQSAAAKYMPRLLMEYYRAGIPKTFVYELVDDNADPTNSNPENNLGLYNNDFTPKPAGRAVKNLIALLADPGASFTPGSLDFTLTGGDSNLHQVLLQKRDGTYWLALWQEVPSFDTSTKTDIVNAPVPVTVNFASAIQGATVFLPDASTLPVSTFGPGSQLVLAVPDEVMLVQITVPEPGSMAVIGMALVLGARRRMRVSR